MIRKQREKKDQREGQGPAGEQNRMVEQQPAHISRDLFCDWQEGKLKMPEETDFFSHIGACTFCAEQFANWMEEGFLDEPEPSMEGRFLDEPESSMEGRFLGEAGPSSNLARGGLFKEPPRYLKEEILNRTRQLDVQASVKFKETSRQVQLMVYSLKVGLAVVASIFLLTVTTDIQNMDPGLRGDQQEVQMQEPLESQQLDSRKEDTDIVSRLRRGSKEITGLLNELSNGLFRIEMGNSENKRNQEVTR